jgi:hypothetical protein
MDIGKECLEFYYRDAVECIRSLYGDPEFARDLAFAPERHFTSHDRTSRLYNEMYTCDWWWTVQVRSLHPKESENTKKRDVRRNSSPVNQGLQ